VNISCKKIKNEPLFQVNTKYNRKHKVGDAWRPQRRPRWHSHMATSHLYWKIHSCWFGRRTIKLQPVRRSRYTKLSRLVLQQKSHTCFSECVNGSTILHFAQTVK